MSSTVEKIKERLGITDVVGSYIKLEKAGKNFKAKCPFHNEKTPSFIVSPDRNSYYCFGCSRGGDIFSFVQEFEGLDFPGALKILAERAGIKMERISPEAESERARLFAVLDAAAKFFVRGLERAASAREYLRSRGITEATEKVFQVGFAPEEWHALHDYLRRAGFSEKEMLTAGLIKRHEKGNLYDVFRSRIIVPITDSSGRVIAFAGRIFEKDDPAKYINTPETTLFKKSDVLLGYDKAKTAIRSYDFSILVEGPFDLLLAHQAGYTNTVAIQGTALTDRHVTKLARLSPNLALALDADAAGITSALKSARRALAQGMEVKVAALPAGSDPADVISKDIETWKAAIRAATHVVPFMLSRVEADENDVRKRARKIESLILPIVKDISRPLDREHFIGEIATRLGTTPEAVRETLARIPADTSDIPEQSESEKPERPNGLRRRLIGLILWQEGLGEKNPDIEKTRARLTELNVFYEPDDPHERDAMIFEAEAYFGGGADIDKHTKEMLAHLEADILKEMLAGKVGEVHHAESMGDTARVHTLLNECKDISKQIETLQATVRQ